MSFGKFIFSVSILVLLVHFSAFSQRDTVSINKVVEKAQKLSQQRPVEKVHIHFDKPYYAVGDTMWFKAYLASNFNQPSAISKVVYLDVVNAGDSLIQTLRLPVKNSVAEGNLVLSPETYKEGNYQVRAYTRWMYNQGNDSFFSKTITIGNTLNKDVFTNIDFRGETRDKVSRFYAKVQFQDDKGKPLAGKKVSWTLLANFDPLDKGRGVTDANGYLVVSSTLKNSISKGRLETVIAMDDSRQVTKTFPLKSIFNAPDIQFFPEGSRLIGGVVSNVAFKAIKTNGLGIDVKGTVVDNTGSTVCSFASQHLGMGMFTFTPDVEKTYKAEVTFADGSKNTYELPKPRTSSIGISVDNSKPDSLYLRLAASPSYVERHQNELFYVVGRSGNVICYAAQIRLQNQIYTASIPKDKFPQGIAQLTLLTPTGSPMSERIVFIQHPNLPTIELNSDKPAYATRQKVRMNISAKYPSQVAAGNYSLSVVDESKVPFNEDAETSIFSSLLLSSELKGYIEKPNYYFHHVNAKKISDLDLLMLSQGYRSYSYRDILEDKVPPVTFMPEEGIEITGTLRMLSGMPVNKGTVQFIVPDKNISVSTQTDADGRFRFTNLVFPDSCKAILSARNNVNARNLMIMVDGEAFPSILPNVNEPDEIANIDSVLHPYLQNSKKVYRTSVVLNEVVIKAKPTPKVTHADYPALSGLSTVPDQLISGDRFKGCPVLLDCLKGGVLGLTFVDENFYVNRDYNAGSRVPVQVFLNGMPVDANNLNSVNSAEVESVEVFLKDDLGTVNRTYNTNGVLVVNMKKQPKGTPMKISDLKELLPQSNFLNFSPLGYAKAKQFYSPKYAVRQSGPVTNDLRSTIYWNPTINTDATGKAFVEFFNADGRGPYRAVIEGMDKEGNLFRTIYHYQVK